MLGSSIIKHLQGSSHQVIAPTRTELNLFNREELISFTKKHDFDLVIHCAARVGGIAENISFPYEMISENVTIDLNVFEASLQSQIPNLIYFGSSCTYPKDHEGLLSENLILSGFLEPTNEGYALAKIVGMKTVQAIAKQYALNWKTFILSNLYGPRDKFDVERSHLVASIIRKVALAKKQSKNKVVMWGAGDARREFTFVEDVSEFIVGSLSKLQNFPSYMNLGAGIDYSVREYYEAIVSIFDADIRIEPDLSRATGMKRKLMDSTVATEFGWKPRTDLQRGLLQTINWYLATEEVKI